MFVESLNEKLPFGCVGTMVEMSHKALSPLPISAASLRGNALFFGETLWGNVYMCCMHSLQFITFGFTFTEKGAWTSHFRLCSWTSRLLSLIWLICWMIRQSMFLRSWTQLPCGATQITKTAAAQTANELYLSNYQSLILSHLSSDPFSSGLGRAGDHEKSYARLYRHRYNIL